jgi:hypothetical protein
VRQSTDLSQLSAINSSQNSILENGIGGGDETANQISVTSPRKTYRSETPDPSKLRSDSPAESQLSDQFPGNFVSFVKVPPQMEFLLQDRYKICSLALNFVAIPKLFYLEQIVLKKYHYLQNHLYMHFRAYVYHAFL